MPTRSRALVVAAAAAGLTATAGRGASAECSPSTGQSTCFDADAVAPPLAPSDFFTISPARAMRQDTWALGLDLGVLHRPVVLHAPSPDPRGRDLGVVGDLFDGALAVAGSPVRHLELGAALPLALYRSGGGLSAVTSQTGPNLPRTGPGDLRLGAGYDVVRAEFDGGRTAANALVRLDVSLPTGQGDAFAGERSLVASPALDADVHRGRFFAALEERARLREPVVFGGDVLGTQWMTALGAGYDILERERLGVVLEAFVAPYLSSRGRTLPDGTRVDPGALVPAEWMLSLRSRLGDFSLRFGGGTGIPLSSERRTAPDGTETTSTFAAVTTPEFRFALSVRYSVVPYAAPRAR